MPKTRNPFHPVKEPLRYQAWKDGYDSYRYNTPYTRPLTPGRGSAWDLGWKEAMDDDNGDYGDLSEYAE